MHSSVFVFNYKTNKVKKTKQREKHTQTKTSPTQSKTEHLFTVLRYYAETSMVKNTVRTALSRVSSQFNNKYILIERDRQTLRKNYYIICAFSMHPPKLQIHPQKILFSTFSHHCTHSQYLESAFASHLFLCSACLT